RSQGGGACSMDELPPASTSATPSRTNSWRPAGGPAQPGGPLGSPKTVSPQLGDELFTRLLAYGTPQETHAGDVLFKPGDVDVALIVVARGSVAVIRRQTGDVPAKTVAKVQAGGFVGELNLLTGQNVYLLCRV